LGDETEGIRGEILLRLVDAASPGSAQRDPVRGAEFFAPPMTSMRLMFSQVLGLLLAAAW
jgi:hypothetical protein